MSFFAPFSIRMIFFRFLILFFYVISVSYDIYLFFLPSYIIDPHLLFIPLVVLGVLSSVWFWSYFCVCWFDGGSVENELSMLKKSGYDMKEIDSYGKCPKCNLPKPIRVHHCSKCNKCYVRFDHHCTIVGNCIGYRNMQPFVIFLGYSTAIFIYNAIISLFPRRFYAYINESEGIICFLLWGGLSYVLFVFTKLQVSYVLDDVTTYEKVTNQKEKTSFYVFFPSKLSYFFPTKIKQNFFVHLKNN